jgi:hypothetical protein
MPRERFWRGPILTMPHAKKITRNIAIGYLAVAALMMLMSLLSRDGSGLIVALVLLVPGLALHRSGSLLAARILLGLTIFSLVVSVVFGVGMMTSAGAGGPLLLLAPALIWGLVLIANLRACTAAKALRDLPQEPSSTSEE